MKNSISLICILFIFMSSLFSSCHKPVTEQSFYEGTNIPEIERTYYSPKDNGINYEFHYYYLNGQVQREGKVVASREEGPWKSYYPDGSLKSTIYYKNGRVDYCHPKRELPYVVLSDPLKKDVPVRMRIHNLYPDEDFGMSSNGYIVPYLEDDELYDFYFVATQGDSVFFYFDKKIEEVKIQEECIDSLATNITYLRKEELLHNASVYKTQSITINKFHVYED